MADVSIIKHFWLNLFYSNLNTPPPHLRNWRFTFDNSRALWNVSSSLITLLAPCPTLYSLIYGLHSKFLALNAQKGKFLHDRSSCLVIALTRAHDSNPLFPDFHNFHKLHGWNLWPFDLKLPVLSKFECKKKSIHFDFITIEFNSVLLFSTITQHGSTISSLRITCSKNTRTAVSFSKGGSKKLDLFATNWGKSGSFYYKFAQFPNLLVKKRGARDSSALPALYTKYSFAHCSRFRPTWSGRISQLCCEIQQVDLYQVLNLFWIPCYYRSACTTKKTIGGSLVR